MSKYIDDTASALLDAHKAISELKDKKESLVQKREALLQERDSLMLQPVDKEDIKELIFCHIDQLAENFIAKDGIKKVVNAVSLPQRQYKGGSIPSPSSAALNLYELDSAINKDGYFENSIFSLEKLGIFNSYEFAGGGNEGFYFFFGDLIKEKLSKHFDESFSDKWIWCKQGMPLAERRARIAEIDSEVSDLDLNIKKYSDQLWKFKSLSSAGL